MISQTPFVVVDVETTGLAPALDHIVEIATVKVLNGEVVDEWYSTVNPGVYVPQDTTSITGITTDMLEHAPNFENIVEHYMTFMENAVFVAHSVEFDRNFINEHLRKLSLPLLSGPYLCTFKLAKQVHPNLAKYGLGNLAETFGIEMPQAHRALHDARATAQLLIKFLRVLQNGGLKQVKDIPGIQNYRLPVENVGEGQVSLF